MSTNCWQGNGGDKSFMSESSLPGLCSAPWGASQEPGVALAVLWCLPRRERQEPCGWYITTGSLKVFIYQGSERSTWSCPVYMGQTHPMYTSCSDKVGAIKVQSIFLFLLFARSGKVLHAELEKCFAKTFFY